MLVQRGAARVAGVRGGVGLDNLPADPADDAGRDGAVEAVWAADEQELVARLRQSAPGGLPERLGSGRLAFDSDHGEIVLAVVAGELPGPLGALARVLHASPELTLDAVVRRHEIAGASVGPADEAAAEAAFGLDGEDAPEHALGERRDAGLAALQRLLGRTETAGQRCIPRLERGKALRQLPDLGLARGALGACDGALAHDDVHRGCQSTK